jgi:fructokinase
VTYGGIEAGGTKWVCATGSGPDDIHEFITFPTTHPEETIARAVEFFAGKDDLAAIGVGSFGPIDVRRSSPTWGRITTTPKHGWADTDLVAGLRETFDLPIAFDTDVNTAALGEHCWGAAVGLLEADYLAHGLLNVICVLSPQRIIVGGGVMHEHSLLPLVRRSVAELGSGYFDAPELGEAIDDYIVAPALGDRAGVLGALELARLAHTDDAT